MMFGGGLLMMALILGLPLALIVIAVVAATGGGWQRWLGPNPRPPGAASVSPAPARVCAHCGQALQPAWAHCPYCGGSAAPGAN